MSQVRDEAMTELITVSIPPARTKSVFVRRVPKHCAAQSDEEAVAENEAAYEANTHTMIEVPGRTRAACPGAHREAGRRLNLAGARFRRAESVVPARPRSPAG